VYKTWDPSPFIVSLKLFELVVGDIEAAELMLPSEVLILATLAGDEKSKMIMNCSSLVRIILNMVT
jgi:hypothetical protein